MDKYCNALLWTRVNIAGSIEKQAMVDPKTIHKVLLRSNPWFWESSHASLYMVDIDVMFQKE